MTVAAAILAAGQSTRVGRDKVLAQLGGRAVWEWSYETYKNHPSVDRVFVVASVENIESIRRVARDVILGGETRQESVHRAIHEAGDAEALLLHDAARPFVSASAISRVIEAIGRNGAAAAAVPVADTIKVLGEAGPQTLDRSRLVAMQTPQGARLDLLRSAHESALCAATDDMALLEAIGVGHEIVAGAECAFKITTKEDLLRAQLLAGHRDIRIGTGYDVHAFSEDSNRRLFLGGVEFRGHKGLTGHSDADVMLHAITDALLGSAALGDIGQHFPDTDDRWKEADSIMFLQKAANLLAEAEFQVINVDVTLIAETPKIMVRAEEIRSRIAEAIAIGADRVSVKATTNERLGFIGRGEGIAAIATVAVARWVAH
jgi:2-C-methyl-D-erythritol 4-phosphate cytidylyltransferase/2-C-methyl-D-erythritol 2,4-cyclodiphosphate synthase